MKTIRKNTNKKNIITELSLCITNQDNTLTYNGTNPYVRGYATLLSVNHRVDKNDFTHLYINLLKIKSFPVLPISTVLALSETYKKNPNLLKQIKYFASLVSVFNLPLNSWEDVITGLCNTHQPKYIHQKMKILSEIILSNIQVIGECNLSEFCKGVFTLTHSRDSTKVYMHGVRIQVGNKNKENDLFANEDERKSKFGFFIYWANKIIKQGENVHGNLSFLLNPRFCPSKQWIRWSPELEEFLNFIEPKLPPNYLMRRHNQEEIEKLAKLYHMKKDLFQNTSVSKDELINAEFLLRPFFKKFIIPEVFFDQFFHLDDIKQRLLEHIMKGCSIRNFEELPLKMDKKACHVLRNQSADKKLTFWIHFALAKLEAEGVSRFYAQKVCNAITRSGGNYDFWIENMIILHRKGLSERAIESVSDYITTKVILDGGTIDFKRIAVKTLINRSDQWHDELRMKKIADVKLPKSEIGSFEYYTENGGDTFIIKQLTSSRELYKEGSFLHHCVYSYTRACMMNRSFIFSLRVREESAEMPLITIEVSRNRIIQAKGSYNRPVNKKEAEIIKLWAQKENLEIRIAA